MMTCDRKKPTAGFWITAALVAVLVGYPLSFGPLAWLITRDLVPEWSASFLNAYTAPLNWAAQSETVEDVYLWYTSFWVSKAPRVR
jgi:hypothetical protein